MANTVALKQVPGCAMDRDGRVREWPILGYIEYKGQMAAMGPWEDGSMSMHPDSFTAYDFVLLPQVIKFFETHDCPPRGLYLKSLRRLPDGGFLAFPPRLADWVRQTSPESELAVDWEPWNHPDLMGEEAWSFALGSVAWRVIVNQDPFEDSIGEDRRERIRINHPVPIAARAGDVDERVASLVDRALAARENDRPALEEWLGLSALWSAGTFRNSVSQTEAGNRAGIALAAYARASRRLQIRRWFRRSGWKAAVGALSVALILILLWSPLKRAIEGPATAGMMPLEVVRTYYDAMDNLNSELLNDATARKVAKNDQKLVDTVYVTSKIRQGYERTETLRGVSQWLDEGQPPLTEGVYLWGIQDLSLTQLSDNRIQARYRLWYPRENSDNTGARPPVYSELRVDVLELSPTRHGWEISRIDRRILNEEV